MTSARARELAAAGRPVATCPECGRVFDPSLDYAGRRGAPPRVTCSGDCRRARTNRRRRELTTYRNVTATLRTMHELEAAGQLPIPGSTLPELPAPPPLDAGAAR